ncbi:MAG: class I SAM-dependent methyltransferase [Phycisphaeraceae bacterium]|nr:class I SAM-dependent methyltransferase [Phycisphaeraceae bacterium]
MATTAERKPKLNDYLSLWILKAAKMRRTQLASTETENYDKFYEDFFVKKDEELSYNDPRMARRRQTILECLERRVPAGSSILDAGCGLGEVLADIPDRYKLFGFDYARSNVEFTKRRLGARADVRQGSIYEIPFPDNSMDAALCLEVLEHIEDDARGVRDIARVLKPGGILIVAVPYTFYWADYKRLMGHFRHYTRQSLSTMLEQNGLKPVEILPNFPNWHQTYTRRYVALRARVLTVGKAFGGGSVFSFKWPWHSQRAIDRLEAKLRPLQEADAKLSYADLDTSTFIVAQKPASN